MLKRSLVFIMVFALTAGWLQPAYIVKAIGANQTLAASDTSFAIQSNGSLWGWGRNDRGQLGDGTHTDRHTPVHIMNDVIAVESNERNTMAITSDNTLWVWGSHTYEQPLEEDFIDQYVPTRLLEDVVSVANNDSTVMAIRTDGSLWSAGVGTSGMLGTNESVHLHFEWVMDDVVAVAVGSMHVLAIKNDGTLWAWGDNGQGQLGDGTGVERSEPVHIMDDVAVIAANGSTSAAVTTDNSLWIWGADTLRAFPNDDIDPLEITSPVLLEVYVGEITSVLLGGSVGHTYMGNFFWGSFMMITLEDGSLLSYGSNTNGQLGNGSDVSFGSLERIKDDVVSVAGSESTVLAITGDGGLWAWGNNEYGAVGDNSTTNRPAPVRIMEGFMASGPPQTPVEPADDEIIYIVDSNLEGYEESDHGDGYPGYENPEHEYDENNNDYEEPSEGLNQTMLLIAGVVIIVILSIAIVILAYPLIVKQKR